ncbi:MAG TPA: ABC transporter substrate-binding protein [Candidatus Saccharimonadales bacterium]|nr:ABC transporter substrate-binding protein [Candidatus Saccharimonadales bacterium]
MEDNKNDQEVGQSDIANVPSIEHAQTPTVPEAPPQEHKAEVNDHPVSSAPVSGPKKGRKFIYILLLLILITIAVAGVLYALKPQEHKAPATVTKKDIPYLTYGFNDAGELSVLYPLEHADTVTSNYIYNQMFEGLVGYKDQIKIAPRLATSWYNPNDTTWVFNLRHGVKFHDGRTMTADDVKYSLDYAVAHQNDFDGSTALLLASSISKVEVLNPYQVKITTTSPDAVLLNRLADLFIIDSKAKLGDTGSGTGPYTATPSAQNLKENSHTLDLSAVNNYWGGHVYTRAVHFYEDPDLDKLANVAASGKLDISGDFTNAQLDEIKSKVSYYKPIVEPDLGIQFLGINTLKSSSPLSSLAARQAAAHAMNIPAILKAGKINGVQVNQVIPPALPGYDTSIKDTSYDPVKAKQLLATVPNASAPITFKYPTGDDLQVTEMANELKAVGFNVNTQVVEDFNDYVNQVYSGKADLFYLGYSSNTLDGLDMINNTAGITDNYNNSDMQTLIDQASNTINPASRTASMQKIEQLIAKEQPVIPLFTQVRTYPLTKPYVVTVDLPSIAVGAYLWQVYQK